MTLSGIWRWRKSLLAQLGMLSAIFALLTISQLIFGPLWAFSKGANLVSITQSQVQDELFTALENDQIHRVSQSAFMQKVADRNPRLRYYARNNRSHTAFGGEPLLGQYPGLSHLLDLPDSTSATDEASEMDFTPCDYTSFGYLPFQEKGMTGEAYGRNCQGDNHYIEIVGIEKAAISRADLFWDIVSDFSAEEANDYLILSAGLLLIALFTLYRASVSLRKVATLTGSIDFEDKGVRLSMHDLPLEIQPLVQALNTMLQRIDEAVERQRFFVATAAHELRTPLTILRTRLEELPDSDVKGAIKADLKRMSLLVEQLLNLTRLKSEGRIRFGEADLVRVARDVCAARAPLAIDCGIEVEFTADSHTVSVAGDVPMMMMAITNLVDNALSFSNRGGLVTIKVTDTGCVAIRDRGPGIPAGQETSLFEPFAKYPPNRNGYGLGLAIVAAAMALHGGRAEVENARDGGAIFRLWFKPAI